MSEHHTARLDPLVRGKLDVFGQAIATFVNEHAFYLTPRGRKVTLEPSSRPVVLKMIELHAFTRKTPSSARESSEVWNIGVLAGSSDRLWFRLKGNGTYRYKDSIAPIGFQPEAYIELADMLEDILRNLKEDQQRIEEDFMAAFLKVVSELYDSAK